MWRAPSPTSAKQRGGSAQLRGLQQAVADADKDTRKNSQGGTLEVSESVIEEFMGAKARLSVLNNAIKVGRFSGGGDYALVSVYKNCIVQLYGE